jgi:hypothetical protein
MRPQLQKLIDRVDAALPRPVPPPMSDEERLAKLMELFKRAGIQIDNPGPAAIVRSAPDGRTRDGA